MDGDEVRLLPAALVMVFSGQAATILALVGIATGDPFAPIGVTIAASLLLAAYTVSSNRRWSVSLGSIVAPLGVPVWLVVLLGMDRNDDPSITLLCAATPFHPNRPSPPSHSSGRRA